MQAAVLAERDLSAANRARRDGTTVLAVYSKSRREFAPKLLDRT